MTARLEDKVAVVTGANGGQGRAVARRFAAEGALVLAVDLAFDDVAFDSGRADLLPAGHGSVQELRADITKRSDIDAIRAALARLGRCDVLYNNAGIFLPDRGDGPAGDASLDVWDRVIGVNLTGAYHMIDAVLPWMRAGGGGVVINIASLAGVVGSRNVAYTASKAGLIGLTKSLAFTHGQHGVRSVALSLGPVDTGMLAHTREPGGSWDQMLTTVPLGRAAGPEEIAGWAAFLASDEAAYANGANIVLDGGRGVGI